MDRNTAHRPVLPAEVVELLRPAGQDLIVDCTVGLGGHSAELLSQAGTDARLIGIDVDASNLVRARERLKGFESVRLFEANFAEIDAVLAEAGQRMADVILADLGVASTHLDDPGRGFSFQADGPLDMRLDPEGERTAADLVNSIGETELADMIFAFGQERFSRRIARAIVAARKIGPVDRTEALARIVAGAVPKAARQGRRGVHPATRTFQALRIAVNDELASLDTLLAKLPHVLAPGGRAGVISFHSLEDGRVKRAFASMKSAGLVEVLTKKPLVASAAETAINPRSRSAKLRGIRRI